MLLSLQALLPPEVATFLRLEVEDIADLLLRHLNSRDERGGELHHYNFFNDLRQNPIYPTMKFEVNRVLMEAWDWLANEGFLARIGDDSQKSGFFVTRRGQRIHTRPDFEAYRSANLLPLRQVHPLIASRVYPAFLRGDYDTAIFQAFKEVEVAVRQAGRFPLGLTGAPLMRAAFAAANNNSQAGPLTDVSLPNGEQEAMAHLFAGSFGVYRNSTGHRHVITEGIEAAEIVMFASQLLRIVDRRSRQSP